MAKPKKPSQADILRLGPSIAALKASMPKKRWRNFVAAAHKAGHTVEGHLSNAPNQLKERTDASLRKEADSTVAAAYKPVMTELSRREVAAQHLAAKRAADDAAYRTWMMGEADKLDAQARAADTMLVSQQSAIATDLNAAQQASRADSLQRMAGTAGNVSDPSESTALDQGAADTRSREQVAAAREHSAAVAGIGDQADQVSRAALIATAAVREATRKAEDWKTQAQIGADRVQAKHEQAKDSSQILGNLRLNNQNNAKVSAELALAEASLGVKSQDIAAKAKSAARTYRLENAKFKLDKWKAEHADAVARAKIELGYDQIKDRQGQKSADRALDKWIAKYKADRVAEEKAKDRANDKGGKAEISDDERTMYRSVETARALILQKRGLRNERWPQGKPMHVIRREMLAAQFDNVVINVANELTQNNNAGKLRQTGIDQAKRLGIKHVKFFWG